MSGLLFGLLGSGEFEPWSEAVDRWLLERSKAGDGRVLVLPTAAAPEGDDVFDEWSRKAKAHYERLEVPAEVVPLRTREDAGRPEIVAALERGSVAYFSGGNPSYLAATLRGTAFWDGLLDAMRNGLGYAGCSAGVACLTEVTYDTAVQELSDAVWKPGLGFARRLLFGPHWDLVDTWIPGARDYIVRSVSDGQVFVGIDEDTAMVGNGTEWAVVGSGGVHVLTDGEWRTHTDGASFVQPLGEGRSEG